jgi:hypothetical protein
MRMPRIPERRLTVPLGAASALLVALAIWPWLPAGSEGRPPSEPIGAVGDGNTLRALPPLAAFGATVTRPLFSPARRPNTTASRPGAGVENRYRLLGLVIAGKERRALLTDVAGNGSLRVAEGDQIEGWIVKRIDEDLLILSSPAGETTLTLQRAAAPPPAKP